MQIELIETFLDLVETRSFNRSADRLGITQSTVSGRIAALESALDVRLFTRSRAGTALSAEGGRFEPHARLLRADWTAACRAVAPAGDGAAMLRIGLQNDLATAHIGDLVADIRRALPRVALYIEPDYSAQMCADIASGAQDFAVLFTPKPHPDLHFVPLGDLAYRLISSAATMRAGIDPASYIAANFSPAFDQAHRAALPELGAPALSVGQSATISALLTTLGGAGFVMAQSAAEMVATGRFAYVEDVAPLGQPIHAAMHLRHRTTRLHRRLTRIVMRRFGPRAGRDDRV